MFTMNSKVKCKNYNILTTRIFFVVKVDKKNSRAAYTFTNNTYLL